MLELKESRRAQFLKLPLRCTVSLGMLHLLAVIIFAVMVGINAGEEAQWQMAWTIFWVLDWPVSLLLSAWEWPSGTIGFLSYPFDNFRSFVFPCLFFGILGTLWYSFMGLVSGSILILFLMLVKRKRS